MGIPKSKYRAVLRAVCRAARGRRHRSHAARRCPNLRANRSRSAYIRTRLALSAVIPAGCVLATARTAVRMAAGYLRRRARQHRLGAAPSRKAEHAKAERVASVWVGGTREQCISTTPLYLAGARSNGNGYCPKQTGTDIVAALLNGRRRPKRSLDGRSRHGFSHRDTDGIPGGSRRDSRRRRVETSVCPTRVGCSACTACYQRSSAAWTQQHTQHDDARCVRDLKLTMPRPAPRPSRSPERSPHGARRRTAPDTWKGGARAPRSLAHTLARSDARSPPPLKVHTVDSLK